MKPKIRRSLKERIIKAFEVKAMTAQEVEEALAESAQGELVSRERAHN